MTYRAGSAYWPQQPLLLEPASDRTIAQELMPMQGSPV